MKGRLRELHEEFDDAQLAIIPRVYSADVLARTLAAIDKEVVLISVLYCWFRINLRGKLSDEGAPLDSKIQSLKEIGIKLAVYNLHRHVIEVCLAAAGGWDTALALLARRVNMSDQELRTFPESKQIRLLKTRVSNAEKEAEKALQYYKASKETIKQLQDLVGVERKFGEMERNRLTTEISNLRSGDYLALSVCSFNIISCLLC